MGSFIRRVVALIGAVVLGLTVGGAFDAADITPNYDGDMTLRGLVAGLALGAVVAACIRD